jgi:amidase
VQEIDGTPMATYTEWMRSCSRVTVTGLPALSVPCGFTERGLPIGMQLVGRGRGERQLLQLAGAFEDATSYWQRGPVL